MNKIEQLKSNMYNSLFQNQNVISVWEGGAKATGNEDLYSDLDLMVVVRDESIEPIFKSMESIMEETCGIKRRYRVPEPTWHKFSQGFYQLDQVGPYFYIDLVVVKETIPDKFTSNKRHGNRLIWFEKEKIKSIDNEDVQTVHTRAKRMYLTVVQSDFLIQTEIAKNIARNRFTEAFPFYYQFLSRHLAVMLNLKYRIDKVDFGLRYAYRDYPEDIHQLIEEALMVSSIDELSYTYEKMLNLYNHLKNTFIKQYES